MLKLKKTMLILALFLLFFSCVPYYEEYYAQAEPFLINLQGLNSEYDDFNVDPAPPLYDPLLPAENSDTFFYNENKDYRIDLVFSTNRKDGADLDIWQAEIFLDFHLKLETPNGFYIPKGRIIGEYQPQLSSEANEFGPYFLSFSSFFYSYSSSYEYFDSQSSVSYYDYTDDLYYFFGSERSTGEGGADIYFSGFDHAAGAFQDPKPLFLNSPADEYYPSFRLGYVDYDYQYYDQYYDENISYSTEIPGIISLYYCDNSSGDFDIYHWTDFPVISEFSQETEISLSDVLENGHPDLKKEALTVFNSEYDDKCPYQDSGIMVFTSNRPDGGDFDLYYSLLQKNPYLNTETWSEPKPFPAPINTEYNEYRPVLFLPERRYSGSQQENEYFIIFSSDRPGGKGGYDLYMALLDHNLFE